MQQNAQNVVIKTDGYGCEGTTGNSLKHKLYIKAVSITMVICTFRTNLTQFELVNSQS